MKFICLNVELIVHLHKYLYNYLYGYDEIIGRIKYGVPVEPNE